jgi:riboflavin synthase
VIPHTQQETIIGGYAPGVRVNLEVDLVARYLERLLQVQSGGKAESGVTLELLQKSGFSS